MDISRIKCRIAPTNPSRPLGLEIMVDQQCVFKVDQIREPIDFRHFVSDDEAEHEMKITLFGKQVTDTVINEQGNIVSDSMISLSDFNFDEIEFDYLVQQNSVYLHNNNSTGPVEEHKFYGHLGCNGTVIFKFTTPVYLWLLEHM